MQIPTNFSAAQAVSIASAVSNRDKNSAQAASSVDANTVQSQLQKSESASPDRDAQGQGDGLGQHPRKQHDDNAITNSDSLTSQLTSTLPPDEPPELLDLVC